MLFNQLKNYPSKLASKSPLDISKSPVVSHMGPVYIIHLIMVMCTYPQETTNLGDGHYIIFDIIENNKTELWNI